ncbi:hypothetical protein KC19_VG163500 [Ceratodon purpureus]|uniref:Uncharacterized protein n=1 Tax=Ceratodon purpureus TaxID=3225 RepID=A0A8T0HRV4_CERPU|nr:hypothetical protein KC19_VG163500 [Ceratodon purpureus]
MFADEEDSNSSASDDAHGLHGDRAAKGKNPVSVQDDVQRRSPHRGRSIPQTGGERVQYYAPPQNCQRVPTSSTISPQVSTGWTWVSIPENPTPLSFYNVSGSMGPPNIPRQWQFRPNPVVAVDIQLQAGEVNPMDDNSMKKSENAKTESLKRKERRANKKQLDEEARTREIAACSNTKCSWTHSCERTNQDIQRESKQCRNGKKINKKKSSRLSIMEKNEAETNRRLQDVMKININLMKSNNLQNMLQIVLISLL